MGGGAEMHLGFSFPFKTNQGKCCLIAEISDQIMLSTPCGDGLPGSSSLAGQVLLRATAVHDMQGAHPIHAKDRLLAGPRDSILRLSRWLPWRSGLGNPFLPWSTRSLIFALRLTGLAAILLGTAPAKADVTINAIESGGNVVFSYSGNVNTTGFSSPNNGGGGLPGGCQER